MSVVIKLCLFLFFAVICEAQIKKEMMMPVPSLVKAAGYPIEKHRATTEDGYVLQLHRIPAGRRSVRRTGDPSSKGKKAILILSGLLGSSSDFVIMGPNRSLAYLLADAGYDVWLGNLRGTIYSAHKNLTRDEAKFWDYSFHEHGKYDMPALIDRVVNITGLDKIMCLCYSMGTTSTFTMLSQKPEYNDKIVAFVALAPAVYLNNMGQMADLLLNTLELPKMFRARGVLCLEPWMVQALVASLCDLKNPHSDLCTNVIYTVVGDDYEQNDLEIMPVVMNRFQPASYGQLEHFGKIAIQGEFTTWGSGLSDPGTPYNLNNVKIPVSIFYGENDKLTEKSQVMRLAKKLKSMGVLEDVQPVNWPKFNHLDFVFAKDVRDILNKPLIKHIDKLYNKYNTS
ncbi:lipase 1-like [Anticarsia gemmatalis]|uniref:lipase 1-like n=1 Tax=Anticarsia gemmatalis TaxID=129554 RepID=UPI003F7778F5